MKENFYEEVTIAGFGGQGIILVGKLLAQAAMDGGFETTYMPAYGAEMRGGTANSMIIISDEPVACPVIDRPSSLIAMNKASMEKFAPRVKAGGLIILNKSLIDVPLNDIADGITVVQLPADDIALELGNPKVSNMVALGAYLQMLGKLGVEQAVMSLPKVLSKRYHNTLDINNKALRMGAKFCLENAAGK